MKLLHGIGILGNALCYVQIRLVNGRNIFMGEIAYFVIRVVNDKNICSWVILKGVQSI